MKRKKHPLLRFVLFGIFVLLFAAAVYVSVVLSYPENVPETISSASDVPDASYASVSATDDIAALTGAFGALPVIPDAPFTGTVKTVTAGGENAQYVLLDYGSCEISAVRPLSAASLLARSGMKVMIRESVVCQGLSGILARKGDAFCFTFSDASAAYCLYAPHAGEDEFLSLIQRLVFRR